MRSVAAVMGGAGGSAPIVVNCHGWSAGLGLACIDAVARVVRPRLAARLVPGAWARADGRFHGTVDLSPVSAALREVGAATPWACTQVALAPVTELLAEEKPRRPPKPEVLRLERLVQYFAPGRSVLSRVRELEDVLPGAPQKVSPRYVCAVHQDVGSDIGAALVGTIVALAAWDGGPDAAVVPVGSYPALPWLGYGYVQSSDESGLWILSPVDCDAAGVNAVARGELSFAPHVGAEPRAAPFVCSHVLTGAHGGAKAQSTRTNLARRRFDPADRVA